MAMVNCSVCDKPKHTSPASLPAGQLICQVCRAERRAEVIREKMAKPRPIKAVPDTRTTTAKGLGWEHQQAVAELRRQHINGSPCDWCGRPMWLDPIKNWDHDRRGRNSGVLHGDHSGIARSVAVQLGLALRLPDRLLHGKCNVQRGDGSNDHLAWVNNGTHFNTTQLGKRNAS